MKNPVDSFAAALRAARARQHLTQRALAEKLHMSVRTIIEIELGRSNPRFETVALLAKEMNSSPDAIVFPVTATTTVADTLTSKLGERFLKKFLRVIHTPHLLVSI